MGHPPISDDITPMYATIVRGLWPIVQRTWRRDFSGGEHIPREGGFVMAANHISYVDPVPLAEFLVANNRVPRFLAKHSLFGMPLLKHVMTGTGQIPVVRGSSQAVLAYDAALKAIGDGDCVCILPEGTLTRNKQLWPMPGKTGAARIALLTRTPLVPVAIWGTHEILYPYRQKLPHFLPRHTVRIRAGAPVDLSDLYDLPGKEGARVATERLMSAITDLLAELRGESAPTPDQGKEPS